MTPGKEADSFILNSPRDIPYEVILLTENLRAVIEASTLQSREVIFETQKKED